jgi:thiol:disulfide interchange protein DsbD
VVAVRRTCRYIAGLTLLCLAAARAEEPHVRAALVADVDGVRPGATFRLGVLLDIQAGWHVYWRNPGDAGLPTDIRFYLPEGFEAGPLQWPIPKVFQQPGDVVGYGYEGSVLHWVTVKSPSKLPNAVVSIRAEAVWLACKETCVPDGGPLSLALPVAREPEATNRKLFADWEARLPVPAQGAPDVASATVKGALGPDGKRGRFETAVVWRSAVRDVAWCPAAEESVSVENVSVTGDGRRTAIRFDVLLLDDGASRILEAVLLYADGKGRRRGVSVPVRLGSSPDE